MVDVAVVGAGLAGLVCARQLQYAGAEVTVIEKSRGLGGRLATRRLAQTWADHGVRYLESQGALTQQLLQGACDRAILHPWMVPVASRMTNGSQVLLETPRYVSGVGMTAVAKALAEGLEIQRGKRVGAIAPTSSGWTLTCEEIATEPSQSSTEIHAEVLILMIPAPQALALLEPLADRAALIPILQALQAVEFDPCITAIAAYSTANLRSAPIQGLHLLDDPVLSWISIEASKQPRPNEGASAVIVQSSAAFAWAHLDTSDLGPVGQTLLDKASHALGIDLTHPDLTQVHRWRYAFCRVPYPHPYLENLIEGQVICGGDWCGGRQVEQALESGVQTAAAVGKFLNLPQSETVELTSML
jgi:renalase